MLWRPRARRVRLPVISMPSLAGADPGETWRSYREELVGFVRRRVGDAALADDVVHDVLLKALAQLETLEDPARLRAWLYRITRNAIADHYRAQRPAEPLPDDFEAEAPVEEVELAERELARCLTPLLGALSPPYREALTLAEVDGLSQREIARRAGLSLSGAKSRVQRARRMVRDALLACCRVELDRRGGVVDYHAPSGCDPCAASGATSCSPVAGSAPTDTPANPRPHES
jgi:RNA polymerase sigma-70 factor (ECF subfamily)